MSPVSTHQANSCASCRVIVADDNHDAADSLVLLINTLGYDAHAVYGGNEAVAACAAQPVDLMICDIQMPVTDGLSAARRIRANAKGRATELVALTALSSERDRRQVRAAGFDRHFVKPIALNQLQGLLESCLGAGTGSRPLPRG